jgi:hypothetical protein
VVEGYEANLGREVTRGGQELFVGLDEGDVEDLAKGIRYLFAGSRYVGCDLCRRGHHLVLVAGVELHVAGLITCWVARRVTPFLGAPGCDQAGELGGDPLLGNHQ